MYQPHFVGDTVWKGENTTDLQQLLDIVVMESVERTFLKYQDNIIVIEKTKQITPK